MIRKIPLKKTTTQIKAINITKYSINSEIVELRESLNKAKTTEGVELIMELSQ